MLSKIKAIKYLCVILAALFISQVVYAQTDQKIAMLTNKGSSDSARKAAIKMIVKDKVKEAIPALRKVVKNRKESVELRLASVSGLASFGDYSCLYYADETIKNVMESDKARINAVNTLVEIGTPEAKEVLVDNLVLPDVSGNVVEKLVLGLGKLSTKDDVAYFIPVLTHKTDKVRSAALSFIEKNADDYFLPIYALLLSDLSYPIKIRALAGIDKLGDYNVVPTLIMRVIDEEDPKMKDAIAAVLAKKEYKSVKKVFIVELEKYIEMNKGANIVSKLKPILARLKKECLGIK